eukprot:1161039-Pelagomonas_calceolata.AAC.5
MQRHLTPTQPSNVGRQLSCLRMACSYACPLIHSACKGKCSMCVDMQRGMCQRSRQTENACAKDAVPKSVHTRNDQAKQTCTKDECTEGISDKRYVPGKHTNKKWEGVRVPCPHITIRLAPSTVEDPNSVAPPSPSRLSASMPPHALRQLLGPGFSHLSDSQIAELEGGMAPLPPPESSMLAQLRVRDSWAALLK